MVMNAGLMLAVCVHMQWERPVLICAILLSPIAFLVPAKRLPAEDDLGHREVFTVCFGHFEIAVRLDTLGPHAIR